MNQKEFNAIQKTIQDHFNARGLTNEELTRILGYDPSKPRPISTLPDKLNLVIKSWN